MPSDSLPHLSATYDPEAKALYVRIRDGRPPIKSREGEEGLIYDHDWNGALVGIEVLLAQPLEILTDRATGNSSPYPVIEAGNCAGA